LGLPSQHGCIGYGEQRWRRRPRLAAPVKNPAKVPPALANPRYEDIMLHALTATIGTLAVIASIKAKLDYARQLRGRAATAAQPAAHRANQVVR